MGELIKGAHTYGNVIRRGDMNTIRIGKYCSIAADVICDSGFNHNTKFVSTYPFNQNWNIGGLTGHPVQPGDITIGNDVWIGEGSIIMGGVTIGDGAVIGARSIVTKDVHPYSVVAGLPAIVRKLRFPPYIITQLLEIKWWDWPDSKVREFARLLMSNDIEAFIIEAKK